MLTGLLVFFAMIGFIIGLVFIGTKSYTKHLMIGLAVLILMCSQVMLGIWRATIVPLVKPKYLLGRIGKRWKNNLIFFHVWNGRLVWILACANILYGSWLFPGIHSAMTLMSVCRYWRLFQLAGPDPCHFIHALYNQWSHVWTL